MTDSSFERRENESKILSVFLRKSTEKSKRLEGIALSAGPAAPETAGPTLSVDGRADSENARIDSDDHRGDAENDRADSQYDRPGLKNNRADLNFDRAEFKKERSDSAETSVPPQEMNTRAVEEFPHLSPQTAELIRKMTDPTRRVPIRALRQTLDALESGTDQESESEPSAIADDFPASPPPLANDSETPKEPAPTVQMPTAAAPIEKPTAVPPVIEFPAIDMPPAVETPPVIETSPVIEPPVIETPSRIEPPTIKPSPIEPSPIESPKAEQLPEISPAAEKVRLPEPLWQPIAERDYFQMAAETTPLPGDPASGTRSKAEEGQTVRSRSDLVVVSNLHKGYVKGKTLIPVLRGVDFTVSPGEYLSIVGQSGSGKSTLLHLIGTLDTPDDGAIHFDGQRIDNLPNRRRDVLRNRYIGMIFQFYHLIPEMTMIENVLAPLMIRESVFGYFSHRSRYRARAKELLEMVGLGHRIRHKPNELSGGEMQRTAIARALITEPRILLADEPTGNLDSRTSSEIVKLLRSLNRERKLTIIMVTHDTAQAEEADRYIRLVDGQIAEVVQKGGKNNGR